MSQTEHKENRSVTEQEPTLNLPEEPKKSGMSDTMFGTILCICSDTIFCISYLFVQFVNKCDAAVEFFGKIPWIGPMFKLPELPDGYSLAISPFWTTCFKELITTIFAFPIFLIILRRGKCGFPPMKIFGLLLVAAFFCETVGVNLHIFAFASIGLALALPFIRTFTIVDTALIGAVTLKEKLGWLKIVTIAVLISAAFLLVSSTSKRPATPVPASVPAVTASAESGTTAGASSGTTEEKASAIVQEAPKSSPTASTKSTSNTKEKFFWGFLAAFITGLGYAIYTVILRSVLRKASGTEQTKAVKIDPFFIVSVVCGFGAVSAAIIMLFNGGTEAFYTTKLKALGTVAKAQYIPIPTICWFFIAMAGILNVVCFYLKNLSLRYATASKVATFSVLQILLQTIFGIFIFHEVTNTIFFAGLGMTILGIILASRTK